MNPISLEDIIGTDEAPAIVPVEEDLLTIEACDEKLASLAALAPGYSYSTRDAVKNRLARTRVPRDNVLRKLEITKALNIREYDRELKIKEIDEQWITLRDQRCVLLTSFRRKRAASTATSLNRRMRRRFETVDACAICQTTLSEGSLIDLPCGHQMHVECYNQSINNNITNCPNCRVPMIVPSSPAPSDDSLTSLSGSVDAM